MMDLIGLQSEGRRLFSDECLSLPIARTHSMQLMDLRGNAVWVTPVVWIISVLLMTVYFNDTTWQLTTSNPRD